MGDELLKDLPRDLPTFLKRFGSDAKCRAYLVRARWPAGFGCTGCGHEKAWSHKKRPIEECVGLRQAALDPGRHHLRADQDRPGALVPGDRPGDLEHGRHLGHGAPAPDGLRQLPDRLELAAQDPPRHGAPGAGAAGRAGGGRRDLRRRPATGHAGPRRRRQDRWSPGRVESAAAARASRRRLGRLRLAALPDASAASLQGFLGQQRRPTRWRSPPTAGPATPGARRQGLRPRGDQPQPQLGRRRAGACRRSTSSSASPSAGSSAPTTAPSGHKHLPGLSRRVRLPLQPPHRQEHRPPLRPS